MMKEHLGSQQEKQVVMQLNDLEVALNEVTTKLTTCERMLRKPTPVGPESAKLPSNHYVRNTHLLHTSMHTIASSKSNL